MTLVCLNHTFAYEMEHILRMFFPGAPIKTRSGLPEDPGGDLVLTELREQNGARVPFVRVRLSGLSAGTGTVGAQDTGAAPDSELERRLGVCLYRLLQKSTGVTPPWGILTGVRPVRLCRRWAEQGLDEKAIRRRFERDYLVQPGKADLALQTAGAQKRILAGNTPDSYSLYISIPFCPTRCLYCSFVSSAIAGAKKLVPDYLRLLDRELRATAALAERLGLVLHTVYVGGGTPTTLDAEQLELLLKSVSQNFDLTNILEYTVEAGRPDTITAEKLEILRKFGVDRISINPQTMDDTILRTIGRDHTAAQVEESYRLAKQFDFSAVNMDLIAGLPGESAGSFSATLDRVLALSPENITLHTLTVKRSSHLREREDAFAGSPLALGELLGVAQSRFASEGYRPYYLYRQKGTVQNLENTGYARPGTESAYNVYSMEEVHTILGAGAGAITKLCRGGHIRRVCNFKYPYEYIARFGELLERKSAVEEFYEEHSGKEVYPG